MRALAILALLILPTRSLGQADPSSPITDPFSRWLSFNTRGWAAVYKNDLARAERHFRSSIEAAKAESSTDPRLLARSYADLAWVLHLTGRADQALPLARWALKVREAYQPDSYPYAQCLYFNAVIEADLGHPDKSAECMERALPILREVLVGGVELSRCRDVLAKASLDLRRFDQADGLYSENLDVPEAQIPAGDPLRMAALAGRAVAAEARGDLEHAAEFTRREAEAQTAAHHPLLPATLARLAGLYRRSKRPTDAEAVEDQIQSLRGGPAPPKAGPST